MLIWVNGMQILGRMFGNQHKFEQQCEAVKPRAHLLVWIGDVFA